MDFWGTMFEMRIMAPHWRSRQTRRIFGIRRLRRSPPPPERPIIQAIKTSAALREAAVHAVINERVRRYSKLSWKLSRSGSFCLRDRIPVCSINRLVCERVSMPGPNRRTKRQAGDYRLPHVHILLSWGSTGQFGASYSAAGAPPEVDVGVCGAAPCTACCCWSAHRPKTPRTRHFPGIAEAWIISAVDQLAWPQSGIELVEAHDFAWRHAAAEMRRHELTRMIKACGGDQLRQRMECRSMEILHTHPFVVNHQSTPAAGDLRSQPGILPLG